MTEDLNKQFGKAGRIAIVDGNGGLPFIKVSNDAAAAEICLMGAHITSYIPKGSQQLIWMSPMSPYEEGKSIRGGIPICWPWFSKKEDNPDAPMHGIARIVMWEVDSIKETAADTTVVSLVLKDNEATRKFWNYSFKLEYKITISKTLELSLKTTNLDSQDFVISEALHTYFNIGDITKISIDGFDGKPLLNKVGKGGPGRRVGTIKIDQEVDEVYQEHTGAAIINDPVFGRKITIEKENSNSSVVWNPWIAKSHNMADFPDDGYKTMVCVETANALEDKRTVKAGASFELKCFVSW